MDLNKEIKLSDLFRRAPTEPSEAPDVAEAVADAPPAEKTSFLKKEISFGRKGPKEPKEPKEPKAKRPKGERKPKEPKEQKPARTRRAKEAQPLPAVPLMRAFDLLPREDAAQDGRRRPNTPQLVLAVVGLVLFAATASLFLVSNAGVADKETEVNDLRGRLASLEQPQEEPTPGLEGSDQALIQERDTRTSALGTALGRRIAWDRVLRDVSLVLPEGVWLDSLAATAATATDATAAGQPAAAPDPTAPPSTSTFQLSGFAKEQAAIAQLLSRMAVLPELAGVQLVSSTATEIGGEQVYQFSLAATLKPAGAGGTT
jgi:Tfp pilus assembly protein PilN